MADRFPPKFELSLDPNVVRGMSNKDLDKVGDATNARVLTDVLKVGLANIKGRPDMDLEASHMKASWSYTAA